MDFNTTTIRRRSCPACQGKSFEYPNYLYYYPCSRCGGSHFVKDVMLTYQDGSRGLTCAGEIELPDW